MSLPIRTPSQEGATELPELPQELLKSAGDYLHDFSSGVTLATTVLLGFIFNSVLGSGASRVTPEAQQATLKLAWDMGIVSILCGFLYMIAFGTASASASLAATYSIDQKEFAKPGVAKRPRGFLREWRVSFIVGGVAVWLQAIGFMAALLCLTHAMWAK